MPESTLVTHVAPPARTAPTLEAVAARAGVSRATASRALRGAVNVSEQARAAVQRAASDLAYSPNLAARSLVTGRSGSIAFLVAESEDRLFADPFFLGLLRGAQSVLAEAQVQMVFTVAGSKADRDRFVRYAAGGHVDGVLLLSLHGDSALPAELESHGVATVLSGRPLADSERFYYIDSDNLGGAQTATEHLIAGGRRRIATITGPLDMAAGQDRLAGYREALRRAGMELTEDLVVTGDFTAQGGYLAMGDLIDRHPDLDAVFAASDLMALGAMRTLQARGLRVPADVGVVGFDDLADSALAVPSLTTVRQPIAGLGQSMATLLLQRLQGETAQRCTVLGVELVQRDSA
ncbi:LacI family DNA-binding transcriptional regulator [soil metagenome]